MRVAWILLLAVGCEGADNAAIEPGVLGDGVWFELEPEEAGQPDGVRGSPGHYTLTCEPNDYPVPESITATGGPGRIDARHTGVWAACSTDWEISGIVRGQVIEMTYAQFNAVDDGCRCQGELTYVISDVPAGQWTLRANGLEMPVSVSP